MQQQSVAGATEEDIYPACATLMMPCDTPVTRKAKNGKHEAGRHKKNVRQPGPREKVHTKEEEKVSITFESELVAKVMNDRRA